LATLADGGQALVSTADARTVPEMPGVARLPVHPAPARDHVMKESA
jgi:hypothetical protein